MGHNEMPKKVQRCRRSLTPLQNRRGGSACLLLTWRGAALVWPFPCPPPPVMFYAAPNSGFADLSLQQPQPEGWTLPESYRRLRRNPRLKRRIDRANDSAIVDCALERNA